MSGDAARIERRAWQSSPLAADCRGLETCAGFYEMLLDVTVMRSVPGLWLETQPNYDSVPVGRCGLSWRGFF